MLFTSVEYVVFFLIVLACSWMLRGHLRIRTYFIILCSLYFYASNNGWQTFILIATTTIDYLLCLQMGRTEDQRQRRALLACSVISNLTILGIFKYYNFFGESVAGILSSLGWPVDWVDV